MSYAASGVQGSKVQFKQASGITAFTDTPGVISFKESAEDADKIDVTPIDSGSEVTLSGFAKPGSASMELAYDPKNNVHQALYTASTATGTAKQCDLLEKFADATTVSTRQWTTASVSKFEVDMSAKGALKANVTFQLSGSPTNTAGS